MSISRKYTLRSADVRASLLSLDRAPPRGGVGRLSGRADSWSASVRQDDVCPVHLRPNYLTWGGGFQAWGEERLSWARSRQHREYTHISFDDEAGIPFGDHIHAVPVRWLWDTP